MNRNTNIANVIDGNAEKSQYDAEAKKVLADKNILAWVLKYSVKEFSEYPVEVIQECIEGEPEIGVHRVLPGHVPAAIKGMNTEDAVPGEGTLTFDIRFSVVTPDDKRVKLIVNVEAQKSYYPGYDLVTRGVFYGARLLSAQYETEFADGYYDDIKKVCSVWVCMNTPKKVENTITRYYMMKEDVHGHVEDTARYDLLEVVMVCLGKDCIDEKGKPARGGSELHGLLGTLFSEKLRPTQKKEILNKEYDIATSVELEGGMNDMCNLSDLIEERGIEKGIERGIEKGEWLNIIRQISKKLQKGKSLSQIADEVEESQEMVERISRAIEAVATDDVEEIYKKLVE